jgi:hypothetical protein
VASWTTTPDRSPAKDSPNWSNCAKLLLQKLEGLLLQIGSDGNKQLLLTGQSLADELAAVEDLQRKIDALLNQPRKLPGSKAE